MHTTNICTHICPAPSYHPIAFHHIIQVDAAKLQARGAANMLWGLARMGYRWDQHLRWVAIIGCVYIL